jgi:hypothetical protein
MPLSQQQQQQVMQHLRQHQPQTRCNFCGNDRLEVVPELAGPAKVEVDGDDVGIYPENVVPYVQVICPSCKKIQNFSARAVLDI